MATATAMKQIQPIFDIFACEVTFASIEINWQKYGIVKRSVLFVLGAQSSILPVSVTIWALSSIIIIHVKFNFIFIIAKKVNKNTNDDDTSIRTLNGRLVRRNTKSIRWIEYFQIIKYWIRHFLAPVVSFANVKRSSEFSHPQEHTHKNTAYNFRFYSCFISSYYRLCPMKRLFGKMLCIIGFVNSKERGKTEEKRNETSFNLLKWI